MDEAGDLGGCQYQWYLLVHRIAIIHILMQQHAQNQDQLPNKSDHQTADDEIGL